MHFAAATGAASAGRSAGPAYNGVVASTNDAGRRPNRRTAALVPPSATGGSAEGTAAAAHAAAAAAAAGRDARREVAMLGGEDFILSQRSGVEEALFKGSVLGVDADVAGGGGDGAGGADFRQTLLRSLEHLPEGLEPSPRFLERVAVHYARNALAGLGDLPGQVPLVLGIWGPKGVGKTFQLELCLRQMGVLPVCISAGELEDEWAGEPGRRLRERYSFAARHAESTGQATCLVISDLDAGVGTFANTFNTVNTQNLQGSLMNLCDDPSAVSTGQDWGAVRKRPRVPIYVTANDLTCLYAPLVREGRMDKFYFEPTRGEIAAAVGALFSPELDAAGVEALLDAFPQQPMDFFGSIKARLVDGAVRRWLQDAAAVVAGSSEGLHAMLLSPGGRAPPVVQPAASLADALAAGAALAAEQQSVLDIRLSREYMKGLAADIAEADELRLRWRRHAAQDAARKRAAAEAAEAVRAAAAEAVWAAAAEARRAAAAEAAAAGGAAGFSSSLPSGQGGQQQQQQQQQGEEEEEEQAPAEPEQPATASGLPGVTPDELAAALQARAAVALDVRSAREWDWGRIKGAAHAPYVLATGSSLAPETKPNPGFLEAAQAKLGPPASAPPVVLYGPGRPLDADTNASFVSKEQFVSIAPNGAGMVDGEDIVVAAARALQAAGYAKLSELAGGYRAWDLVYRPDGRRRAKGAFRDKSSGELEWWTASN